MEGGGDGDIEREMKKRKEIGREGERGYLLHWLSEHEAYSIDDIDDLDWWSMECT